MYKIYTSKRSRFSYKGISVVILPGVFHPRFTYSTKFFVDFISDLDLEEKYVLELGCGSGLISLHAARKKAAVTASDINLDALNGLEESARINNLKVETIYSDLFDKLVGEKYDFIFINPPYYPNTPQNISENAWFCGEGFEYFKKLFKQLENIHTKTYMILSEDCQLESIQSIALEHSLSFETVSQRVIKGEKNYIFKIKKSSAHN